MKSRNGFVSNSSSSSFILLGFKLTSDQADELMKIGSQNKFETLNTPSGVYIGNIIMYDECLCDPCHPLKEFWADSKIVHAAKFCGKTPNEAYIHAGGYER